MEAAASEPAAAPEPVEVIDDGDLPEAFAEPEVVAEEPAAAAEEPVTEVEIPAAEIVAEPVPEPVIEVEESASEPVAEPVVEPVVEAEAPIDIAIEVPTFEEEFRVHKTESINEAVRHHLGKSVNDAMQNRRAWQTDMPGTPVKNIISAISLNDRVLFINTLFHEDPVLFQNTLAVLNSSSSFQEAEVYIANTFPEWKMDSDVVYRFMMAVRRKLR